MTKSSLNKFVLAYGVKGLDVYHSWKSMAGGTGSWPVTAFLHIPEMGEQEAWHGYTPSKPSPVTYFLQQVYTSYILGLKSSVTSPDSTPK